MILTYEGRSRCIFADGIISAEWATIGALPATDAPYVQPGILPKPASEDIPLPFELGLRGGDDLDKLVAQIREKLELDSENLNDATKIAYQISQRFIRSTIEVRTDQVMRKGLVTVFQLVEKCRERRKARRDEDGTRLCSNILVEVNRALRAGSQDMEVIEKFVDAYHFLVAVVGDQGTWELQNWISEPDWQELGAVLEAASQQWAPQIEKDAHIADTWKKRPYLQTGFYKRRSLISSALAHYNWEGLLSDQIDALRRESREWAAISVRTAMPPLHQIRPEALGLIVAAPNVNLQERTRVLDRRVFQGSMDNPVFHYLVAKYLPFLSEVETAHMLTDTTSRLTRTATMYTVFHQVS